MGRNKAGIGNYIKQVAAAVKLEDNSAVREEFEEENIETEKEYLTIFNEENFDCESLSAADPAIVTASPVKNDMKPMKVCSFLTELLPARAGGSSSTDRYSEQEMAELKTNQKIDDIKKNLNTDHKTNTENQEKEEI